MRPHRPAGCDSGLPTVRGDALAAATVMMLVAATLGPRCAAAGTSTEQRTIIDDAADGHGRLGQFDYIGRWQHVSGKHDGRSNGTSTRSTHLGDVAIVRFVGTRVRLFGVLGPSGGKAGLALDDASAGKPVDFYSPVVRPHALLYESPPLPDGPHTLAIVVLGQRAAKARYYYVNLDDAEVIESPGATPLTIEP